MDGSVACSTSIAATPIGFVNVFIGDTTGKQSYEPGAKTDVCYFSRDGGTTAIAQGSYAIGDILYWNGSIARFQLYAASYKVSFMYNA